MKVSFEKQVSANAGTVVVGVFEGSQFSPQAAEIDTLTGGAIRRAVESSTFTGKFKQSLIIKSPANMSASKLIVLGLGDEGDDMDALKLEMLGAKIAALTIKGFEADITMMNGETCTAETAARLACGYMMRSWVFDEFKTEKKDSQGTRVKNITVSTEDPKTAEKLFKEMSHVLEGVNLTRAVVSRPGNIVYPETMVKEAKALASSGVKVTALGEKELEKMKMGALLGVGQGSDRETFLCTMEWMGGPKDQAPICVVGKGITFDTGGIDIKPRAGMEEMKFDMGGAGAVLGLMKALSGRKAPVNVIGVMALAENMVSGSAQRPGDIVTSYSGKTIEILDTDAEGRLVLADALWYAQEKYKPQLMVDLATLTGAIMVALGYEYAGLYSNDDQLAERLLEAGQKTDEKLWRMPMGEVYNKQMDSKIADVRNLGGNRWGGSITAAQFLERFTNGVPWAHLDIAGTASDPRERPLSAEGATGYGVRLLNEFLSKNYG